MYVDEDDAVINNYIASNVGVSFNRHTFGSELLQARSSLTFTGYTLLDSQNAVARRDIIFEAPKMNVNSMLSICTNGYNTLCLRSPEINLDNITHDTPDYRGPLAFDTGSNIKITSSTNNKTIMKFTPLTGTIGFVFDDTVAIGDSITFNIESGDNQLVINEGAGYTYTKTTSGNVDTFVVTRKAEITEVKSLTVDGVLHPLKDETARAGLAEKVTANADIVGGTHTKITYDEKGLVTGGENLSVDDIPDLSGTYYTTNNPSGYITGITSGDVTTALGYTPYNSTNPSGYITGITGSMVTTALGYTPYDATNPAGYISGITGTMVTTALGFTPYNSTNPSGYQTSTQVNSAITTHNTSTTAHADIRQVAEEALSRSSQAVKSLVFDTFADMETYLKNVAHKDELKVGDNLYIKDTSVEDFWVSAVLTSADPVTGYYYQISPLSGEKPDIANMVTTNENQTISGDKNFTGALQKNGSAVATESFVTGQGYITGISSSDVTTALGYTPYNSTNPSGYISGITSAMVTTALGYTPYNSTNPSGYISSASLSGLTDTRISSPTSGQYLSYNGTKWVNGSLNALQNTATGSNAVGIGNNSVASGERSIAIGGGSASHHGGAKATQKMSIAIGANNNDNLEAAATAIGAIQLGVGTNFTAGTFSVGLTTNGSTCNNYQLLGSDGKIPSARIPDLSGTYQEKLVSGTNIKTINSTSLVGTGDVSVQPTITGGATTITSSNLTASRALVSNSSGKVAVSEVTSTELGYLDGVTSSIQTQLNNKLDKSSSTNIVYGTNSSGEQQLHGLVYNNATAWSIPRRNGDGQIFTGEPTENLHAATKKYVDDLVGDIETLLAAI